MAFKIIFLFLSVIFFLGVEATPVEGVEEAAPVEKVKVSGILLERGTRSPISRKVFYVVETEQSVRTKRDGTFSFNIEPGTYKFVFPISGYERYETTLEINPGEDIEVTFRLEPVVLNPYRIVVQGERHKGEVSVQRITVEEASKIPGTNRDVLQAIKNLPGVTTLSIFNGYGSGLVIRGSAPEDSGRYVNEHSVPILYHFGGLEPVFEPELVESLDFYAGGFSAEYFNAMGGIVQVNLRDPREDRWGGYLNLSLLSSSFMIEGPLTDKDSVALAFKRGFLDLYMRIAERMGLFGEMLGFSTYPFYYDLTFMYVHRFSNRNKLKFTVVGSWDEVRVNFDNQTSFQKLGNTASSKTQFIQLAPEWHYRQGNMKNLLSPAFDLVFTDNNAGESAYLRNFFFQANLSQKMEIKLSDIHTLKWGLRFLYGYYTLDVNLFAIPKEGEVAYNPFDNEVLDSTKGHYWFPGFYFMDQITYGPVTSLLGFNMIYNEHDRQMTFDPRLSIRYNLAEKWTVKGATGMYSQIPSNDERYEPWGTPGIKPERSVHLIGGIEYNPIDTILLDIQGYYKWFFDLVSRDDPDDLSSYSNQGKGYAYGLEFLLRHKMTDHFFGWIAYSFCISRRKDLPDAEWRPFDLDINHNLTLVASYKFNKRWQVGGRFRLQSGMPYTNVMYSDYLYDSDNNFTIPSYFGPVNRSRMPVTHQLDVRLDRYWIFDKWILSTYLDVQNVYYQKNVVGYQYSRDYNERKATTGLPIMFFLGLKGDF